MYLTPYHPDELKLAWCYRVYFRCHTHWRQPVPALSSLSATSALADIGHRYGINILEQNISPTELILLLSLSPGQPLSAVASQLKGQLGKQVRESVGTATPASIFGKGYFACTVGDSRADQVDRYLDIQPRHHGYQDRILPPVYGATFQLDSEREQRFNPHHAVAVLQFHVVLVTQQRLGIFGGQSGPVVARAWNTVLAKEDRAALLKVSFLPDHVHVAVRTHPSVAPSGLVLDLMNEAQRVMTEQYGEHLIERGVTRLWQPGAYVGSYGDLASNQISAYVRSWESSSG
jgi:REP element-mobilizing transposase RayT